jgi:hypothetical protein
MKASQEVIRHQSGTPGGDRIIPNTSGEIMCLLVAVLLGIGYTDYDAPSAQQINQWPAPSTTGGGFQQQAYAMRPYEQQHSGYSNNTTGSAAGAYYGRGGGYDTY